MNSKLSIAIAAILGAVSGARSAGSDHGDAVAKALEEITVTAQRRTQSMQDVPISMQAFTGQALQQLNIQTFDDYIKYLPNVTSANNGPGQNEVFMRGLSAGSQASQGSSSTGTVPERRHLSRQSIGPVAEPQSRHLCRRFEPYRGSRRPAGHPVRRGRASGRDSLHHQSAQDRRDRSQRQGRLRHHRSRRQQFGCDGGPESAADRRAHGGARRHLQRSARRLHRQRAGDLHAQEHRPRHSLRGLSGRQRDNVRTDCRTVATACRRAARRINNNSVVETSHQPGDLPRHTRSSCCTSSTTIGTCFWRRPTKTCIRRECSTSNPTPRMEPR